jgi:hypothetical protein
MRSVRSASAPRSKKTEIKYRNHNWSTGPIVDMPSNRKRHRVPEGKTVSFLKTDEK